MFHALRTTIAVDPADYRARKRREKPVGRSFDRPRRHFLKSVRGGARGVAVEIVDLFIYPRRGRSLVGSTRGVIFILQTLNKARPRRSTLETAY